MLFAAALVASVPCDGSPALACEVNTLAPANSSSVWALMGGHIQAKIAEFWGAAAVETVDFVEMGHVHAEGWDAKVVPPLAAWLDKA